MQFVDRMSERLRSGSAHAADSRLSSSSTSGGVCGSVEFLSAPFPLSPSSSTNFAGTSAVFLHLGYPLQPRNFPRRPVRMIIGLPHSSQSISVAIGPFVLTAGNAPPVSCETNFIALSPPSLSAGISASTIFRSSPVIFATCRVARHLGNALHPRNGPRLLSRRIIALPHFSHFTGVKTFGLGGSGFPSLSRLMIVSHSRVPSSFLTLYPVQPRNSPKRPFIFRISRPQFGHLYSLFSCIFGLPCLSTALMPSHSGYRVQLRKNPF